MYRKSKRTNLSAPRPLWFGPVVMFSAFLIVFGAILWLMQERTNKTRQDELLGKAESIGESLNLRLKGNTDYLLLLAEERSAGTLGATSFQERASQYVRFHPELINITWVDADYVIRDVAPLAPNKQILGLRLNLPEPKRISHQAMASRKPHYTRPFEAIQGNPSFEIWVPVYRKNTFLGLFGGVYSCDQVLKQLILPEQHKLYHLSLVDNSGGLLGELPLNGLVDESLVRTFLLTSKDSGVYLKLKGYRQVASDWRLLALEFLCLALVLGMVYALWGLKREIEERRRTWDALKISQARLEETMQQAKMAHWEYDANSGEFILNNTYYEMFDIGADSEVSMRMSAELFAKRFFHPQDMHLVRDAIQNALTSTDPDFACQIEVRGPCEDGKVQNVIVRFTTERDETGWIMRLVGSSQDITERKQLEERLRQSLKMESIGRLAGGVAHDFNNKLTVINGYVELSKLIAPNGEKLWRYLNEISKAAEHSRDLTGQLLAFSRRQIISPKTIDLNEAIKDTQKTLPRLIGEDILLSFNLTQNIWKVNIDPTQLDQIIMNLAVNARDAMPDGGELSITTTNTYIDETNCREYLDARPGDYIRLTVSDSGHGIDREDLKHIFEPFFTTKEIGKGTGLGLATIYGIVTQNNGFINVYSEPGHGTIFNIYLPRQDEVIVAEQKQANTPVRGSGTVLLIEDDEAVRNTTASMLEEIGYKVITVEIPQEAISFCEDRDLRIDVILTDVIMPGKNGKEIVDAVKLIRPDMRVIFMSGYTSDIISKKGLIDGSMHFIQKPFDMSTLSDKLRQALSS